MITFTKSAPGLYSFETPRQRGWIAKEGNAWEIRADKAGFDGKIIRQCRMASAWTFAEAKQKASEIFTA